MIISYELYLARVGFILERLRPLNILDETQDDEGAGKVRESQVQRGDPTLFLHFKNSDYARIFFEVSERHHVTHSSHNHNAKMVSPSLDTGTEKTYSRENMDNLFSELKEEIIHTAKQRVTRMDESIQTRLETLSIPQDLKSSVGHFMNNHKIAILKAHSVETVVALTDALDLVTDAVITGKMEHINTALSFSEGEPNEEETNLWRTFS